MLVGAFESSTDITTVFLSELDPAKLQEALETLALATKALQRTLVEKGVSNPEDFTRTLQSLENEDGTGLVGNVRRK